MGDSKYRPISAFPPAEKALYQLARRCPMIAEELSRITPLVVAPGALKGSPAAIDKYWRLYIDPKGWAEVVESAEEGVGVLMHEFGHVAKDHHGRCRRAGLSRKEGNRCADLEENSSLLASGFRLPKCGLFPEDYGLPGCLLLEEYAELLRKRGQQRAMSGAGSAGNAPSPNPQSGGDGDQLDGGDGPSGSQSGDGDQSGNEQAGHSGSPSDGREMPEPIHGSGVQDEPGDWEAGPPEKSGVPGVSQVEGEMIRQNLARKVVESPNKGSLPASLQRWAQDFVAHRSKVDWRNELRAAFSGALRHGLDDTTYSRRSRRQGQLEHRLPATVEVTPTVAVIIDTSGSIDDDMLGQAVAETLALARKHQATVYACGCDAQASEAQLVRSIADIKKILVGSGGSDMRPAEDAIAKIKGGVSAVIYIGDGDADFHPSPRIRARHIAVLTSLGERVPVPAHWKRVLV